MKILLLLLLPYFTETYESKIHCATNTITRAKDGQTHYEQKVERLILRRDDIGVVRSVIYINDEEITVMSPSQLTQYLVYDILDSMHYEGDYENFNISKTTKTTYFKSLNNNFTIEEK